MNTQVQKNVVMVTVAASMFGGYKRTTESDITAAGGKLPDTEILTKGGKHIFPTDKLAAFGTIKKALLRKLWEFGVKSFGTGNVLAICEDDLDEAEQLLDKAKADFDAALADLRVNYDTWLEDYIKTQPNAAAADIIRQSALTMEDACSRFKFSFDTFMPTPVGKNGSIESMAAKLTTQLYAEVATAAEDAYDKTFMPKGSDEKRYLRTVGQRAKSPIKACRDKLSKLSFLDSKVLGAVEIIDRVLATTQATGFIEDTPSNPCAKRLLGLVVMMKDAGQFEAAAARIVASSTPEEDIEVLCGVQSVSLPQNALEGVEQDAQVVQAIEAIAEAATSKAGESVTGTSVPKPAVPEVKTVAPEEMFF